MVVCWDPISWCAGIPYHGVLGSRMVVCWDPISWCAGIPYHGVLGSHIVVCWDPTWWCAGIPHGGVLGSHIVVCWDPTWWCAGIPADCWLDPKPLGSLADKSQSCGAVIPDAQIPNSECVGISSDQGGGSQTCSVLGSPVAEWMHPKLMAPCIP